MMISNVKGDFSGITGSILFDPLNPSGSCVQAAIQAATVNTGEPQRDRHIKSADFLDVSRYPEIAFRSVQVSSNASGYEIKGNLTIHGVTREVLLQVESLTPEISDPDGRIRRGASAITRIARKDFGLTWNMVLESGGFLVGEEVEITIDIEMVRETKERYDRGEIPQP